MQYLVYALLLIILLIILIWYLSTRLRRSTPDGNFRDQPKFDWGTLFRFVNLRPPDILTYHEKAPNTFTVEGKTYIRSVIGSDWESSSCLNW